MAKKEKEAVEELEEEVVEPTPEPEPKKEDFKPVMTKNGMMKRFPDGRLEPL